jgi:hypothetical protein
MKMKTLFFSVLLSAVMGPAVLWAQPTLVDPIEVFEGSLDDPANEEIALHWDVTNLTDDTLSLMVTRNIIQLVSPYNLPYNQDVPGAYDRFCWGPLCYDYGQYSSFTTEGYLVELLPNETDSTFIADYYPAGVAGVTALEYCFHPVEDVAAGTCQQVLYCLDAENCALNVNESTIESSPLFPQPVTGLSSFPYQLNGASRAELTIHNAAGQLVEQQTLRAQQGVVYIDAAAYPTGMYVLALTTPRGERVTEQFLVQ